MAAMISLKPIRWEKSFLLLNPAAAAHGLLRTRRSEIDLGGSRPLRPVFLPGYPLRGHPEQYRAFRAGEVVERIQFSGSQFFRHQTNQTPGPTPLRPHPGRTPGLQFEVQGFRILWTGWHLLQQSVIDFDVSARHLMILRKNSHFSIPWKPLIKPLNQPGFSLILVWSSAAHRCFLRSILRQRELLSSSWITAISKPKPWPRSSTNSRASMKTGAN